MGLGYNSQMQGGRGMGSRGRGRGSFNNQSGGSDYFQQNQSQSQNDNATVQPAQSDNAVTEKSSVSANSAPAVTQSGNNVQVVTTGQTPQQSQPVQSQQQQQSSAPIQSSGPRGGSGMRGRGFSRGFSSRGRGSFNNGPPRQQFDTRQPSNLTPALPPPSGMKMGRYDQGMQPGPKRGRYENGPYMGNRSSNIPPNPATSMPPSHHQSSYNMPQWVSFSLQCL
jgi:hypothetical protein